MKQDNVIAALIILGLGLLFGCSSKSEAVKETIVVPQETIRIVAEPATPTPTAQAVTEGVVRLVRARRTFDKRPGA